MFKCSCYCSIGNEAKLNSNVWTRCRYFKMVNSRIKIGSLQYIFKIVPWYPLPYKINWVLANIKKIDNTSDIAVLPRWWTKLPCGFVQSKLEHSDTETRMLPNASPLTTGFKESINEIINNKATGKQHLLKSEKRNPE